MATDERHLCKTHREQLRAYNKYFTSKIDEQVGEVEASFSDCREMRLLDEMYSVGDVTNILSSLQDVVAANMRTELEQYRRHSVLFLQNMLMQAEGQDAVLRLDTKMLDDATLLAALDALNLERKDEDRRNNRLDALSGTADVKLVARIKELQEDNDRVHARFEKLSEQCKKANRKMQQLGEENEALEEQLGDLKTDYRNLKRGNEDAAAEELQSLRSRYRDEKGSMGERLERCMRELTSVQEQLAGKVHQTKQFRQLKDMVREKNKKIRELQNRLSHYERGEDLSD